MKSDYEYEYERKKEWSDFYSSNNYVKDNTTNLRMAAPTEETCKANNGFVCKVKGVDTCFKNTTLCDQHPACDPGEGTGAIAQDEFGCFEKYKEKGLTSKDATHQCQSVHHNEASVKANLSLGIVMIEAVRCDGIPTCWKSPDQTLAPDESFCDNDWLTIWVPAIFLVSVIGTTVGLLFAFARVFWRIRPTTNDPVAANDKILRDLAKGSDQELKEAIADPRIKVSVIQMQHLGLTREERRKRNRTFLLNLGDSQAESAITMKKRITKETCMQIIEDFSHRPSCMGSLKEAKEDLVTFIKKKYGSAVSCTCNSCNECCGKCYDGQVCSCSDNDEGGILLSIFNVFGVAFSYLDLVKDLTLTVTLIFLIGVKVLFSSYFTLFQSTIVWVMIFSVGAPLLLSAIQTTIYHPATLLDFNTWQNFTRDPNPSLTGVRISMFCTYPFMPSIQINNKADALQRKEILLKKTEIQFNSTNRAVDAEIYEELEQLEEYLDEVRKAHLIFKRNEGAFELVPQQSIQLVMLLLSQTTYPTVNGLQTVFEADFSGTVDFLGLDLKFGEIFLIASVCWSFKTGSASFIKIRTESKSSFLPATAKVALGLRALLFSVTRICAIITFFGPFLGLWDALAHLEAEEITLEPKLLEKLRNSSNPYWDNDMLNIMYRDPEITNYTMGTLQHAFFIFLGLLVLHDLAIFALKMATSIPFRKARWQTKLLHLLESTNVPDTFMDWDDDEEDEVEMEKTPEEYRIRWKSVLNETVGIIGLHMFSNLLMLLPIFVTTSKVREKHLTLRDNIGTFAKEDEALDLLTRLSWQLPIFVISSAFLDLVLAYVYLKWLHPWKIILEEEKKESKKQMPTCIECCTSVQEKEEEEFE